MNQRLRFIDLEKVRNDNDDRFCVFGMIVCCLHLHVELTLPYGSNAGFDNTPSYRVFC